LLDQTPDLNGVDIVIDKRIPVAAGLGGGSANAAATLWGMNQLFGLQLTTEDLMRLGKQLGADTPFCILGGAALGRGIGEALTPLPPLKEAPLALGNPGFEVPTAWVYGNLNLSLTPPRKNVKIFVRCLQDGELKQMAAHMHNSLEYPVFSQYPVVAGLKADFAAQPGGYGALMSGSGATVFALMQDHDCANRAALHFKPRLAYCTVASTSSVGLSLS
jgi:4-diphosphocytidyl-2-C-methyl-D-erythritol kinase